MAIREGINASSIEGPSMTCARAVACLLCLLMIGGLVFTQPPAGDSGPKAKTDADTSPRTFKVEKKPFRVTLTVKGILAPAEAVEISYRPHVMIPAPASQGPVTVRQIVAHGTEVKQGDVLVAFDSTKLDEVIADLEKELQTLEASLKLTEEELPLLVKSVPVELTAAETAKQHADLELKYFMETDRDQQQKLADVRVKVARFGKEYAEEELRQLEKMYKANDLTEETEKMILRRQQNYLEQAIFWYQYAVLQRDYTIKHALPFREKSLTENQRKQELALVKAQKTLDLETAQKKAALVKLRFDRDKNRTRLDKLLQDRAGLTIRAPSAGIVYYGRFHKGQWTGLAGLENKLVKGGSVASDEPFLTVVKPRPVVVHLTIDENDVHLVKPGLEGKAKLLVDPERKLPARVATLAPVPAAPGKFDAEVIIEMTPADARLMPGMACSVHFVPYAKKDALAIPSRLIREEDDRSFVDILGPGGKSEKREITTGKNDGEHTEILTGLRAGDRILLERPDPHTAKDSQPAEQPAKEKGTLP
jgi:HlyD family secretion protein